MEIRIDTGVAQVAIAKYVGLKYNIKVDPDQVKVRHTWINCAQVFDGFTILLVNHPVDLKEAAK